VAPATRTDVDVAGLTAHPVGRGRHGVRHRRRVRASAGLSLIGYDLVAKKPTDLLGPGVNGGTVVNELVIDHNS